MWHLFHISTRWTEDEAPVARMDILTGAPVADVGGGCRGHLDLLSRRLVVVALALGRHLLCAVCYVVYLFGLTKEKE